MARGLRLAFVSFTCRILVIDTYIDCTCFAEVGRTGNGVDSLDTCGCCRIQVDLVGQRAALGTCAGIQWEEAAQVLIRGTTMWVFRQDLEGRHSGLRLGLRRAGVRRRLCVVLPLPFCEPSTPCESL